MEAVEARGAGVRDMNPKDSRVATAAFEVLEPCEGKLSRPVLRGLGGRQRPPGYSAGGYD